jgi:hypothetical protein
MTREVEADADGALVHLRIILRSGFALTLRHRFIDGAKDLSHHRAARDRRAQIRRDRRRMAHRLN